MWIAVLIEQWIQKSNCTLYGSRKHLHTFHSFKNLQEKMGCQFCTTNLISFSSINIILTNFVNYIYLWSIKMLCAKYFIFTQLIFLKLLFFGVVFVCLFVILFCFVFFLFVIFYWEGVSTLNILKNVNSLLKECAKSWCV